MKQDYLYRYTSEGEGIFTAGKRLLPESLINEVLEAKKWLPKPSLNPNFEYKFYLTSKGKEQYENTLLNVHRKYLKDIKLELFETEKLKSEKEIAFQDQWQVVFKK